MQITAWGTEKELMDFLSDSRVHPLVTRDVVVKRLKRGWLPEISLTKGIADEGGAGDTTMRREARKEKMEQRIKMFLLAQEVRRKHSSGVEIADLQHRYQLSKSQVEKMISGSEYFNLHWSGSNIPEAYKETVDIVRKKGLI